MATTPPLTWPFGPVFEWPFSGDVVQNIAPRVGSPDIAGVPEIEAAVVRDVASYGRQLGWLTEAVLALARAQGVALPEIEALAARVETVKAEKAADLRADARHALERLKAVDPQGWAAVLRDAG